MLEREFLSLFENNEKRSELRLNHNSPLYIETISAEPGSEGQTEVIESHLIDASANGFQIRLDSPLVVGAIHSVSVCMESSTDRYALIAEVRWLKQHDNSYRAGLMLFESDGTEIIAWKQSIAGKLE